MSGSLTSFPHGWVHTLRVLSLHHWGQGTRENVSDLLQLPMSKTKEWCLSGWPQLCLPYSPPAARSSSWMCSVETTVPAEATGRFLYYRLGFGVYSPRDLLFQYTNEESNWVTWNVILNSISKHIVAKRVEVPGKLLLGVRQEPPERTENGAGYCRRSWVPPVDWETMYFVRML